MPRNKTKLEICWQGMKQRCFNLKSVDYPMYGGRGITVCDEWLSSAKFMIWAIENGYCEGLQLDRIDNNTGYSPDNCRFVTAKVNSNNRSNKLSFTCWGETKSIAEWAEDARCAVKAATLYYRANAGWKALDALTKPSRIGG